MMQVRPGKQAPDRQALQGLAGAQVALNSFLAELAGGPLRFGQGAFSTHPPASLPGRVLGRDGCGNLEPLCETCIPTHLYLLLALGPWICDSSAPSLSFLICTMGRGIRPQPFIFSSSVQKNLDNRGLFYIFEQNTCGGKT